MMKIKEGLKLRKVAGTPVVLKQGETVSDITSVISFNSTSEFLWNTFVGREFTEEEVADALMAKYGIDADRAKTDSNQWIEKLSRCGVINS